MSKFSTPQRKADFHRIYEGKEPPPELIAEWEEAWREQRRHQFWLEVVDVLVPLLKIGLITAAILIAATIVGVFAVGGFVIFRML